MYVLCVDLLTSDNKARLSKYMKHFIKELHTIIKTNPQESDSTLNVKPKK